MATTLAKAYVQIVPSSEGISGSISKVLSGESANAGRQSGESIGSNLVGTLKKVVVGAGLGVMVKEALSAGGDLQQSFGGLDTLYGEASEAAKKYASEAVSAGISMNDYAEQAVSFGASLKAAFDGDQTKAVEAANTAIMDMADNAAKMGTPLESIQNAYQGFAKGQYNMLDNLKLGYGGTKTEMERLLADAEKLSGQKYDLDNLGDVYSAIHVIQEDLGLTGVAADEASTTFTGSMGAMKAAAENTLAALTTGGDVSGSLRTLVSSAMTFFNNNLIPMVTSLLKSLPGVISELISAGIRELNIIASDAQGIVDFAVNFIKSIVENLINAAPYLLEAIWNIASALGEALFNYDWAGAGNDLIANLKNGLEMAGGEIFGEDLNFITVLFEKIQEALPDFLQRGYEILSNVVNGILEALPSLIETAGTLLVSFVEAIYEMMPKLMESGFQLISNLASGIMNNLPAIITSITQVIANLLATILKNLPKIVEMGIKLIGQLVVGIIKAIPKIIETIPQIFTKVKEQFGKMDWSQMGKDLIDSIVKGLKDAGSAIWEALKAILGDAFDKVKKFFKGDKEEEKQENAIGDSAKANAQEVVKSSNTTKAIVANNNSLALGATIAAQNNSNDVIDLLDKYLPVIAKECGEKIAVNSRNLLYAVREENNKNTRATSNNVLVYG